MYLCFYFIPVLASASIFRLPCPSPGRRAATLPSPVRYVKNPASPTDWPPDLGPDPWPHLSPQPPIPLHPHRWWGPMAPAVAVTVRKRWERIHEYAVAGTPAPRTRWAGGLLPKG